MIQKVRLSVSAEEKDLVQKARELKKLEGKRAEAVALLAEIDTSIARVRGEIGAIVAPPPTPTSGTTA